MASATQDSYRQSLEKGQQAGSRYELAVSQRAPTGRTGLHLANLAGNSLEFRDHREYQPGDDLRRIDWGAYARSDKLVVKLYRQEISPHLDLVIDASKSMGLDGTAKAEGTLAVAAALATAAENAGYSHAAWLTGAGCRRVVHDASEPSAWDDIEFAFVGSVPEAFAAGPPGWRRQGVRVLLSDLLWLGDPLATLSTIAGGAAAIVVVQVLAAADADPPQRGNVRLEDSETGQLREVFVDAASQQRYKAALARHQENWALACRQVGAVMVTLIAEDLLRDWDLSELVLHQVLRVP